MDGCAYFASLVICWNIDQSVIFLSPKLRLYFFYGKIIFTQYGIELAQGTETIMLQHHADNICHLFLDISFVGVYLGRFFHRLVSNL